MVLVAIFRSPPSLHTHTLFANFDSTGIKQGYLSSGQAAMALDGEECIEERVNEQEALESIFVHEYSVAEDGDQGTEEDGWVGRTFDVRITPTGTEEVDESEADAYSLGLVLRFTYTEAYPNEGLPIEFRGVAGLDEEEEAALQEKIDEVVRRNRVVIVVSWIFFSVI